MLKAILTALGLARLDATAIKALVWGLVIVVLAVSGVALASAARHAIARHDDKVRAAVLLEVERTSARKLAEERKRQDAATAALERKRGEDEQARAALEGELGAARAKLARLKSNPDCRLPAERARVLDGEAQPRRPATKPSGTPGLFGTIR